MKLNEEGVTFRSPLDGTGRTLTPENTIAIQEALGSDIAMILDECVAPTEEAHHRGDVERATERTLRWAERASKSRKKPEQAVFGIVQGGTDDPSLRAAFRSWASRISASTASHTGDWGSARARSSALRGHRSGP